MQKGSLGGKKIDWIIFSVAFWEIRHRLVLPATYISEKVHYFSISVLYMSSPKGVLLREPLTLSLSPSFFLSPPKSAILRRRKVIMMSLIFHFFFTLSVSNTFLLIIMSMHTWNSMVYMFGNYFDIMGDGFFMKWKSQAIFSFIG